MENFEAEYKKLAVKYFKDVQKRFGPAKPGKWELNIIEYDGDKPAITYPPGFMLYPRIFKYNVTLSESTKTDLTNGIFQLSHESVHRLSPTGDNVTNNLEEGVAVYYSKIALEAHTGNNDYFDHALATTKFTGYPYAYQLFLQLLADDKEAVTKLRAVEGRFTMLRKEHFKRAGLIVDETLIDALLEDWLEVRPIVQVDEPVPDDEA
jgi:hypothetical protein